MPVFWLVTLFLCVANIKGDLMVCDQCLEDEQIKFLFL
jgi:hypothetical protein